MKKIFLALFIIVASFISLFSQSQPPQVLDKIIAIVGNKIILKSEIEMYVQQMLLSGEIDKSIRTDELSCEILEEMLLQKLLLMQAEIDSIEVSDEQLDNELDRRIRYFTTLFGNIQELEKYYEKTVLELKEELREPLREQLLIMTMNDKLLSNVNITPSEVEKYYKKLPEDSIPIIPAQWELGVIAIKPTLSQEEKNILISKLQDIKKRIEDGADFEVMARLYSEDPATAKNGGATGYFTKGIMEPSFENTAFSLTKPGEISPIIETSYGFHLLQLIDRKGEQVNVRHILIRKQPSNQSIQLANKKADSIYNLLINNEITFEEAAKKYSYLEGELTQGGLILSSSGGFTLTSNDIDPKYFPILDTMKNSKYSKPFLYLEADGSPTYRILWLKNYIPPHKASLKTDYFLIQLQALEEKKRQALEKWVTDRLKDVYVKIDIEYHGCDFKHPWIKKY
ncbi:MAG: peptidylprolyl isomerase [Bacteroidales bacterium]|jgi:peptidyl-prolyl cis-trans isomerase SurA|nr:peptidylprolyl isomerase [Bacteroidales bacterium]MDI9575654.1 peptidylprolyl isomerase [Bacteroidota bacterium]MDD3755911.1 peptidylprolyl isomerase [Bacteroidales bacterium]MDY0400845.1 peptidylprolyl isomerase [Bacteroidales bacterium]HHW58847.1 peptidylprolyl isomerase [Bacteroidales bacterium]